MAALTLLGSLCSALTLGLLTARLALDLARLPRRCPHPDPLPLDQSRAACGQSLYGSIATLGASAPQGSAILDGRRLTLRGPDGEETSSYPLTRVRACRHGVRATRSDIMAAASSLAREAIPNGAVALLSDWRLDPTPEHQADLTDPTVWDPATHTHPPFRTLRRLQEWYVDIEVEYAIAYIPDNAAECSGSSEF